jgi:hypothetical protein
LSCALFNIEAENGPFNSSGRTVSISIRTCKFNKNWNMMSYLN